MTNRWDWDAQSRNKRDIAKPPYTVRQNLKLMYKNMWNWEKGLVIACIIKIPTEVALPMLTIFMSKTIIQAVTDNTSIGGYLTMLLSLSLALLAVMITDNYSTAKIDGTSHMIRTRYLNMLADKIMTTDYTNIATAKGQQMIQRAVTNVDHDKSGTRRITYATVKTCVAAAGLISYSVVVMRLHPLIVLYLIVMSAIGYFASKSNNKWEYKNRSNWVPLDKKLSYVEAQTGAFRNAKDIRIYGLKSWFLDLFRVTLKERTKWLIKLNMRDFAVSSLAYVLTFFRDGLAYAYLIYKMIYTDMPVSDFVLYFGMIAGFAEWLKSLFRGVADIQQISLGFCDLREFLELKDRDEPSADKNLPDDDTFAIDFNNVSFTYPGSDKTVIDKLSLHIEKGEKIALVGLNGAGKTTLVKLLCGLHEPTEGAVTIGGTDTRNIGRSELFAIFSVVFQDVYMLPMTLAENIASAPSEFVDSDRARRAAETAGLADRIARMPNGFDTKMVKSVFPDSVELSGGEEQKFALARALYKNGKIIVLDEPTAALDPIAENEMYLKYSELTAGRTSVFISHRLSSTSFCDRIILIEDGNIAEVGSHAELMERGGKYRALFDIQSHYYKSDPGEPTSNTITPGEEVVQDV